MARQTGTGMRLRGNIQRPVRYEEDPDVHLRKPYERKNGTKPAFPHLLAQQVIPFNPNHPPAAFPSLPLTAQIHRHEEPRQQTSSQAAQEFEDIYSPAPKINAVLDVSRPGGDAYDTDDDNIIDFSMSNNIAAGDLQGVDALDAAFDPVPEEVVQWSSLDLTFQYRIFRTLCKSSGEENAAAWLSLAQSEVDAIKRAVSWREKYPLTLTQYNAGQNSHANWLEPGLMMKHSDFIIQISKYELGSPLELLRAGIFVQQVKLPLDLLGTWELDPLGSGQLVESMPLTQLYPAGALTCKQLQHVRIHGAGGLRLPLPDERTPAPVIDPQGMQPRAHQAKAPRPILRLKYATKRAAARPVGRPRKRQPASLVEQSNTVKVPQPAVEKDEAALVVLGGRAPSHVSSGNISSSSEDHISILNRWTQPVPKYAARAEAHIVEAHHQSMVESVPGSTKIRSPQDSGQADATANSQNDQDLATNTRPNTPSIRSPTQASVSSTEGRTPRLKLKISNAGVASVVSNASDAPVASLPPFSTGSGKSIGNFAATPSVSGHSPPDNRATLVSPSLPPWSTPKPLYIKIEKPRRVEDEFKQSTRSVHVSTRSPTRFGDANNFGTRLVMPQDHRPFTPDPDDLGVFASAEDVQDSSDSADDGSSMIVHQRTAQLSDQTRTLRNECATTVEGGSRSGPGTPKVDEIVSSIERDIDMLDAPPMGLHIMSNTPIVAAPTINADATASRSSAHVEYRRSPSPPRSISPISVNEDFEEYHAWLRGETTHGPMPQEASLALKSLEPVHADVKRANTTPVTEPSASRRVNFNILRLPVMETNEALQAGLYSKTEGLGFKDPGENGGGDWEDSAPKQKKKTPKKTSSKKATPTQNQLQSTPKSATVTKKAAAKKSSATPKISKRTTKAQSLAASETPVIRETRSRTATPTPGFQLRIPAVVKQDVARDKEPRRSARLSSAEVTDDSDAARSFARNKKINAPLRAKLTPVSRLRQSMTPSSSAGERSASGRVATPAIGQGEAVVVDSASEIDSDATGVSSSTSKPRKKWAHKDYKKTRESSRLSEMELPNMKV